MMRGTYCVPIKRMKKQGNKILKMEFMGGGFTLQRVFSLCVCFQFSTLEKVSRQAWSLFGVNSARSHHLGRHTWSLFGADSG